MKLKAILITALFLLCITGFAQATLTTIGTAEYNSMDYKLIWDDDNNGNSIVWLDYSSAGDNWSDQNAWAASLDSNLTINIDDGYSVDWGTNPWRLPNMIDGEYEWGCDGTTTAGYNITTSEMGHLFYEELGNLGYYDTSGDPRSSYGLQNIGNFDNLVGSTYWSDSEYATYPTYAWTFCFANGYQDYRTQTKVTGCGLAVRSGEVTYGSNPAPVPEPCTMLLLGTGLLGLSGVARKKFKK